MKNVFKKGLVVLAASLFVTSVFADTSASTAVVTQPGAATVPHHNHVMKCKKGYHFNKKKNHCVMGKKHKKAAKAAAVSANADATTPATTN